MNARGLGLDHKNIYNLTIFISIMPIKDTSEIKEKIISILRRNGPGLPVHIAREIESSTLFTSAFLSELASEKRIKISQMKVGNSPLYYLSGQEQLLEKFSHYLKSKEKEAFTLLKGKKIIKDSEQDPAIRVALREIKDFAIPFKKDEEIFWRYFTIPITEFKIAEKPIKIEKKKTEKTLDIFDTSGKKERTKRTQKKKISKTSQKEKNFFNKVKEFLTEKSTELIDIISFSKNEIILKVKDTEGEKIVVAYNKKRISDSDIIKAAKKSTEFNLPYIVLSLGEPLKKVHELIRAVKNLHSIEKLK
jgi:hypothetical protein